MSLRIPSLAAALLLALTACPADGNDDAADSGSSGDSTASTTMTSATTASTTMTATTASDSGSSTDTAPAEVDFVTQIQPLIDANCVAGCHEAGGVYAAMDLTAANAYTVLTTQAPVYSSDSSFVVPNDSAGSFLSRALHGTDSILRQMPLELGTDMMGNPVGVEGTPLADADIQLFDDWIDGGAMP
ncbi:MAG: hypothetical protein IPH07_02400 [Deltaproteobacteria bacterium]|nr:hypothetical protein [Deltaproteobacteria bacterium]MBK8238138.1 hypothetical protein [Deltaproteobacteria bacterium]MBK8718517.1 hypothetical protein [Deltaproteobacteria bacterium]MBP7288580.1 hypothetical protein [Nannocystaceae bacterium]